MHQGHGQLIDHELSAPRPERAIVPGVLFFIIADLIVFAMLFAGFMVERRKQLGLFDQGSATLDVLLGTLNTLVLVTSGYCAAKAVHAAREGRAGLTGRWLLASMGIGAAFGVSKLVEYSHKFDHGLTMLTNDFYMFYFVLTGAHFLHFLGGMVVLAYLWVRVRSRLDDGQTPELVEAGAAYWHMVDLLWIFIFPMLYLLGPR